MNVLFINDSTSSANWGDRAAATSLRSMIAARGGEICFTLTEHDLKRTSFRPLSTGTDAVGPTIGDVLVRALLPPFLAGAGRRLGRLHARSRRSPPIPAHFRDFEPMARKVVGPTNPWPELAQALRAADVAVIHGDGAMAGTGIMPRTLLFLSYLAKRYFEKPVVIVNHTLDLDDEVLLEMAQEVYPLYDDVIFRERVSADSTAAFGRGTFAPDSAFAFAPIAPEAWLPVADRPTYFDVWPDTAAFAPSRPYICIGGSSIFGGTAMNRTVGEQYALLIEHLRLVYDGQIVLTASDLVDQPLFRQLATAFDLPMVGVTMPVQQAVDLLGNADAYIGGRWHPSIFALRGGAPVVPLSAKTFKMAALIEMADLPPVVFDAFTVGEHRHAIGHHLMDLMDEGEALRTRLRSWAEGESESCWENVAYLKRWAMAT